MLGIVFLVDAAWLSISQLTLAWQAFGPTAIMVAACLAWYGAGYLVQLSDGPRTLASAVAFGGLGSVAMTVHSQLVMTLPFPMADELLASLDQAVGFDWVAYLAFVAERPWLSAALMWVYDALGPGALLVFAFLHFSGRRHRASEYLALTFIAAVVAITIGAAFPSIGAVAYFKVPSEMMAGFPAHTGGQWVAQLEVLRSGAPVAIGDPVGLVALPSYHVALSMFMAWGLRGIRILAPLSILFAVGTAASAPIIGGHYLVDLIAGAVMAVVLIAASRARRLRGGRARLMPGVY